MLQKGCGNVYQNREQMKREYMRHKSLQMRHARAVNSTNIEFVIKIDIKEGKYWLRRR